jgi:hypothetical protein
VCLQSLEEKDKMKTVESVATTLERERDSTIKEWLRRVNLVSELTKVPLSNADRTGHLLQLFAGVICRLRSAHDAQPVDSIAAAAHGKLRFAQGYSAAMLVEESRIFQVSTFGMLHLHRKKLDQNQLLLDVITIADETDRQLTQAVCGFMTAQATT